MTTNPEVAVASTSKRQNPHFFDRDPDGSVRLRIRLDPVHASMIEEAAGKVPLMTWIHQVLQAAAREQVEAEREKRPPLEPPA